MAVMLETSLGALVIDLMTEECPMACKNFLKLCKIGYYNGCVFHEVRRNSLATTGNRTGLYTPNPSKLFKDEIYDHIKHDKVGLVAMSNSGTDASQFYITLGKHLDHLDGMHTIFGEVVELESLPVLQKLNEVGVDSSCRPLQNIRIRSATVLDDPYDDPQGLQDLLLPPLVELDDGHVRLEDDYMLISSEQEDAITRKREAHTRAVALEALGDIPKAEIEPPKNILFVRRLHKLVDEEALQCIFRTATAVEIIRDHTTSESLCYGFVEFASQQDAQAAYFQFQDVNINDQRIKLDFSQSTAKLWKRRRTDK